MIRALQYNKKFSYGHKVQGFLELNMALYWEKARRRESAVDGSRVMARLRTARATQREREAILLLRLLSAATTLSSSYG
jgi:hypothetical protein